MPLRIGVVGVGSWGLNLARTLHALGCLAGLCDLREEIRAALGARFSVPIFSDLADMLRDLSLDAVAVATPPRTHAALALQALQAGKDVFVEKPLDLDLTAAEKLVAAEKASDRFVMVGHLMLYHPALIKLKSLIDDGELGRLFYLHAQRVNLGQVRRDENAMWSLAPHDIAVLRFLLGEEPTQVQAVGGCFLQRETQIEDVVFITLRFPSGCMAHVHVSWLDPNKIRRLKVVGSRQMAVFDDMAAVEKLVLYDKGVVESYEPGVYESYGELLTLRTGDIRLPQITMAEPLRLEMQHFMDVIATRRAPRSTAADGLAVIRILKAAQDSLHHGGASISLCV